MAVEESTCLASNKDCPFREYGLAWSVAFEKRVIYQYQIDKNGGGFGMTNQFILFIPS
jgi:hypothetical protein